MKKWFLLLPLVAALVLFGGCSDDDDEPTPPSIRSARDVTPIAYDESLKVAWTDSPDASSSGFLGYYIYISTSNLAAMSDSVMLDYQIWDTPQMVDEFLFSDYEGAPLDSNARYYMGVRAVLHADGKDTLSPIVVVETSPVKMGTVKIYEFASDSVCAFNFTQGLTLDKTETTPEPDLYLVDYSAGVNGLKIETPSTAGVSWTRVTTLKTMGTGNLDDYPEPGATGFGAYADITLKVYAVKTGDNYAKLVVSNFGGISPNRWIEFSYKYQNKPNYLHF